MRLNNFKIAKVYSGLKGCACGCLGKYYKAGPMVSKVVRIVNEAKTAKSFSLDATKPNFRCFTTTLGNREYSVYTAGRA